MDQINLVIAELQLVLAMLETKPPVASARLKALLAQAAADLSAATKAITGDNPGIGET
ncbi:MAG: hypothetical protein J0L64_26745 [Acidobacteria bacterium]|nr:hypothetical protein [Acidobacteriota bacterium]